MYVFPVIGRHSPNPVDFLIRKRNGLWSVFILDKWVKAAKDVDSQREYWVWLDNCIDMNAAVDYVYRVWLKHYRGEKPNG